ncbi:MULTISPECIES: hypothetical protein [Hydrocarboniphaga]|jgi:hypothetical protein|uniref:Uncharacterized protein n=1 Tax=Hydrocarboniphaga effusa AP103 TaxID=1172194 RepID=I8T1C7_9GAMM|nr:MULTISPECIES: hypothetical protein [Hydrocarboniphaga]EIT67715.1 hypothetical protein WQQ_41500 [Hydrocarboniphaga effusa AP103]MDZ4079764.1 hypothetical protein [Hydrocarboniphaga sp.]
MSLTPEITWMALLAVQTLHLLHHLLAKRHISIVEVMAGAALLIPIPAGAAAGLLLMILHIGLILVQLVGSIWIRRLSPGCGDEKSYWATLG